MLGDYLCRVLIQVFGYVWPAYQCYKAIEQKNSEAVREWCIYWFIMALFALVERVLDVFVFWIPLYYEAKLLFVVWLWYPAFKGAVSLYTHTLQPLLSAHEATIDRQLAELRGLASDAFSANFSKVVAWIQEKAQLGISRVQDMQQKQQQQQQPARRPSAMGGGGGGRASADGGGMAWASPRNAAQAAFNAFSSPKRE